MRSTSQLTQLAVLATTLAACSPAELIDGESDDAEPQDLIAATTVNVAASADTTVSREAPTTAFGTAASLEADASPEKRTLLRFTVDLPAGAQLSSARLRLYTVDASPDAGVVSLVGGAWTEATTWNTAPPVGAKLADLADPATAATWREADVSSIVQGDGVYDFYVTTPNADGADYASREAASNRPQLALTYTSATTACASFGAATSLGGITETNDEVREISGLVASRANAGVLWLHNDSGDANRLYPMSTDRRVLGTYTVTGATASDWEDIAIGGGPTAGASYLYVGDIGSSRNRVTIWRVPEPTVSATQTYRSTAIAGVTRLDYKYPGAETYDAETLLADPVTRDLFVVTKGRSGSKVFRAAYPHNTSSTPATLELVASIPFGSSTMPGTFDAAKPYNHLLATAGDISPDGAEIVVRTYNDGYLWRRAAGQTVGAAIAAGSPCPVPVRAGQEAIGFAADASRLYMMSEGSTVSLYATARNGAPPSTPPTPPTTPPTGALACPAELPREVFRDDFSGTAVDTTKWDVIQQNNGGSGAFTQLTKMLRANVTVAGGTLHVASKRHCTDPYSAGSAENPARCAGTNYYSGGWLKTKQGYAPERGLMVFHAKMPAPVRGIFPALWGRNTQGGTTGHYLEMDLIETWWDQSGKGVASDPNLYASTTHFDSTTAAWNKTRNNQIGPVANLVTSFHVWEVEWDATVSPAQIRYYYRDRPGAARVLTKTVNASSGWDATISETELRDGIRDVGCTGAACGMRPYVDFAVHPETAWHVGVDTADVYDPGDLEVDSVIVCGR